MSIMKHLLQEKYSVSISSHSTQLHEQLLKE